MDACTLSWRENQYLGEGGAAVLRLRFPGQKPRWIRRRLAAHLQRPRSLLRQSRFVSGYYWRQRKSPTDSRQHFSTSHEAELCGTDPEAKPAKDGSHGYAVSCRRNQRRSEAQQISQPMFWPGRL